jgi:apolipoprotein D and lipocalin family protein
MAEVPMKTSPPRFAPTSPAARALALALLVVAALGACAHGDEARTRPLTTVPVDLTRYQGSWFELARLPAPFQEGCECTRATYTMRDDGTVGVFNQCVREGKIDEATGRARAVGPGELEVTFFWPFAGDYNVLALDEDYRWAVVGSRDRRFAWILSRSKTIDDELTARLVGALQQQGYDTDRLLWTRQDSCPAALAAAR